MPRVKKEWRCTPSSLYSLMARTGITLRKIIFTLHEWSIKNGWCNELWFAEGANDGHRTELRFVQNTGLFKMIIGVLTTCHKQYTWDRFICIFLFNRTILQVFVTYLIGALYLQPLSFYKHQYDNRVRSKRFVACQRWWFQWRFWFLPSVPGYLREEEKHKPLDLSVRLHTAISRVVCMTSCYNPNNHFE